MAEFSLVIMASTPKSNAIITAPIILNIMSNVFVEESFEMVREVPFAEATVGGFAAGLGFVALKNGYISYRTVQLPNIP